ncbi:hypothetical protein YC2023_050519 [Brassica napus]
MLVEVELSLEMLKDIGRELGDTHRARGELGNAWGRERRLGYKNTRNDKDVECNRLPKLQRQGRKQSGVYLGKEELEEREERERV